MTIELKKTNLIHSHTPGPWIVTPSSNPQNGTGWRDIVSNGCVFSPCYVGEALEQDAHLIASAPDLLEAAKKALQWIKDTQPDEHGNPDLGKVWGMLESAIGKANLLKP
jgi:hypothetical protein